MTGSPVAVDVRGADKTYPNGTHALNIGALALQLHDPWAPPAVLGVPGLWLDRADGLVTIIGLPGAGWNLSLQLPALSPTLLRWQAFMLPVQPSTPPPQNGLFALSRAFDIRVQ